MALVRQRLYAVMPLRHLLPVGDEDAETSDRHRLLAADAATGRDGARQATPQRPRGDQFAQRLVRTLGEQFRDRLANRGEHAEHPDERPHHQARVRIGVAHPPPDASHRTVNGTILVHGLAALGTHPFESRPPMSDTRLGHHHDAPAAQAYAPAEILRFGECGEPVVGTAKLVHGLDRDERAREAHREHVTAAVILLLIRFAVDHQRLHTMPVRIRADVMQVFGLPVQLLGSQHRCSRIVTPRLQQ